MVSVMLGDAVTLSFLLLPASQHSVENPVLLLPEFLFQLYHSHLKIDEMAYTASNGQSMGHFITKAQPLVQMCSVTQEHCLNCNAHALILASVVDTVQCISHKEVNLVHKALILLQGALQSSHPVIFVEGSGAHPTRCTSAQR